MARKNEWPLDKMCLQCDVTKKHKEDFSSSPREGAYIHSLYMEGARWDTQTSLIAESILKDLTPTMPVIFIKVAEIGIVYCINLLPFSALHLPLLNFWRLEQTLRYHCYWFRQSCLPDVEVLPSPWHGYSSSHL